MQRTAVILYKSADGRRCVALDVENAPEMLQFLQAKAARLKKFRYIVQRLVAGLPPADHYGPEDFNDQTKGVTAIKIHGHENIRFYCQETTNAEQVFVIIAAELHENKKNQELRQAEKNLIRRVAGYTYDIIYADDAEVLL